MSFVMFLCHLTSGIQCAYTEPPFYKKYCVYIEMNDGHPVHTRTVEGGRELVCPPQASTVIVERKW